MFIKYSIVHIDLCSGIGGFAYAADQVCEDIDHAEGITHATTYYAEE